MRGIVWLVMLCVVAVVAATTLGSNDGLVTVYWAGWRTELSLNLFLILLLAVCALLFSAAQALRSLLTLPERASEWRALRRERAAHAALQEALVESHAGRYTRAHKAALRALSLADEVAPLKADEGFVAVARLLGAEALHRLQDRARRDALLQPLLQSAGRGGSAEVGACLLAAEWAIDERDADRAGEVLARLPAGAARRTHALRLRLQAHRLARRPLDALATARLLAKHQGFTPVAARGLMRSLVAEAVGGTHDLQQLQRIWQQLDMAERRDAVVVARAAEQAVALGAAVQARDWLRPFWERPGDLERDDRDAVALALIGARGGIEPDWLPRLESALGTHGHEPALAAAVGMAFADRQLWGKARPLLEQAAAASQLPAQVRRLAWLSLARLSREGGDEARAQQCERAAASLD